MRNAAVINRRHESGNIANHSAAKTNDERLPVQSCSDHLIANRAGLLKRLRFLARRNRDQNGRKPADVRLFFARSAKSGATLLSEIMAHVLASVDTCRAHAPNCSSKSAPSKHSVVLLTENGQRCGNPLFLLRRVPMFQTERMRCILKCPLCACRAECQGFCVPVAE